MNPSFAYLPPQDRKKIMLICDDIRVHSGVATVAKEIVSHTAQHFNWVNLGGAINHPEQGKRLDLSQATNEITGLTDSSVSMYPVSDYGNPDITITSATKKTLIDTDVAGTTTTLSNPIDSENNRLSFSSVLAGNGSGTFDSNALLNIGANVGGTTYIFLEYIILYN